jgi:hypothetical protein
VCRVVLSQTEAGIVLARLEQGDGMGEELTYAIGDVHGRLDLLMDLLSQGIRRKLFVSEFQLLRPWSQ